MLKKIVLFDDDEDILAICRYILEEAGWEVVAFTDCVNAATRVQQHQPDIILMDNWIPDSGGIEATRAIKRVEGIRDIPVIYFSANSNIQELTEQAGAESYLAKPFEIDQLLAAVHHWGRSEEKPRAY